MATVGACLATADAEAQSTGRYLTWANRPASTTPGDVVAAQTRSRNDIIPRRVAPSQGPARPAMQAPTSTIAVSRGLTPASAWIGPRVTPAYASGAPNPIAYDAAEAAMPPVQAPLAPSPVERAAIDPMAPRRDAPVWNLARNSATAAQDPTLQASASETATATPSAPADPLAPRRDARIFQMRQSTGEPQPRPVAETAPSAAASVQSGQSGARYYSVHREAGRHPDPTALPEPVYFDSVTMDLAESPETELPVLNTQNRRPIVPNSDPSLP